MVAQTSPTSIIWITNNAFYNVISIIYINDISISQKNHAPYSVVNESDTDCTAYGTKPLHVSPASFVFMKHIEQKEVVWSSCKMADAGDSPDRYSRDTQKSDYNPKPELKC